MIMRQRELITGAIVLPTLLLLSSITLAISLSFSFYSVSGIQIVSRQAKSNEALAAAQSGIYDGYRRIARLISTLPDDAIGTDPGAVRDGLDALEWYTSATPYPDQHTNTTQAEMCYNLLLGTLGQIDTCGGEVALEKMRIRSLGRSGNVYRELEAILSLDPTTYQITIDSIEEIAYTAGDPPAVLSVTGANPQGISGGQEITVTGSNFLRNLAVTIGSNAATDVLRISTTTLTATAPAQASAGLYTVIVTNHLPDEQSGSCTDCMEYRIEVAFEESGSGSNAEGGSCTISVAWGDAEICVRVPTGALDDITVRSNNLNSNSMNFTVQ